jgi:hypothetical protein
LRKRAAWVEGFSDKGRVLSMTTLFFMIEEEEKNDEG